MQIRWLKSAFAIHSAYMCVCMNYAFTLSICFNCVTKTRRFNWRKRKTTTKLVNFPGFSFDLLCVENVQSDDFAYIWLFKYWSHYLLHILYFSLIFFFSCFIHFFLYSFLILQTAQWSIKNGQNTFRLKIKSKKKRKSHVHSHTPNLQRHNWKCSEERQQTLA